MRYLIILLFLISCSPSKEQLVENCADNIYYSNSKIALWRVKDDQLVNARWFWVISQNVDWKFFNVNRYQDYLEQCEKQQAESPITFEIRHKEKRDFFKKSLNQYSSKLSDYEKKQFENFKKEQTKK